MRMLLRRIISAADHIHRMTGPRQERIAHQPAIDRPAAARANPERRKLPVAAYRPADAARRKCEDAARRRDPAANHFLSRLKVCASFTPYHCLIAYRSRVEQRQGSPDDRRGNEIAVASRGSAGRVIATASAPRSPAHPGAAFIL